MTAGRRRVDANELFQDMYDQMNKLRAEGERPERFVVSLDAFKIIADDVYHSGNYVSTRSDSYGNVEFMGVPLEVYSTISGVYVKLKALTEVRLIPR
jgi:hypothetical protein